MDPGPSEAPLKDGTREITMPLAARTPLEDVDPNTMRYPTGHHIPHPLSIVSHTRVWLPNNFPSLSLVLEREDEKCPEEGHVANMNDSRVERGGVQSRNVLGGLGAKGVPWEFLRSHVCDLKHTCSAVKHRWRGVVQKSGWLAETLAPRVVRNPKVPVKELQAGLRMDYKRTTNYH